MCCHSDYAYMRGHLFHPPVSTTAAATAVAGGLSYRFLSVRCGDIPFSVFRRISLAISNGWGCGLHVCCQLLPSVSRLAAGRKRNGWDVTDPFCGGFCSGLFEGLKAAVRREDRLPRLLCTTTSACRGSFNFSGAESPPVASRFRDRGGILSGGRWR